MAAPPSYRPDAGDLLVVIRESSLCSIPRVTTPGYAAVNPRMRLAPPSCILLDEHRARGQYTPFANRDVPLIDDFIARSSDELSLVKGDRVELIERDDEFGDGWFLGKHLVNGNSGLFPEGWSS